MVVVVVIIIFPFHFFPTVTSFHHFLILFYFSFLFFPRCSGDGPFTFNMDNIDLMSVLLTLAHEIDLETMAERARRAFPSHREGGSDSTHKKSDEPADSGIDWLALGSAALNSFRERFHKEDGSLDWDAALAKAKKATVNEDGEFDLGKAIRAMADTANGFLADHEPPHAAPHDAPHDAHAAPHDAPPVVHADPPAHDDIEPMPHDQDHTDGAEQVGCRLSSSIFI